jgi:hypothetical protein
VTTRLRSSSGHGVDWRSGVDFQDAGAADVFESATRDSLYVMRLLDTYLINQRIDTLSGRYMH